MTNQNVTQEGLKTNNDDIWPLGPIPNVANEKPLGVLPLPNVENVPHRLNLPINNNIDNQNLNHDHRYEKVRLINLSTLNLESKKVRSISF